MKTPVEIARRPLNRDRAPHIDDILCCSQQCQVGAFREVLGARDRSPCPAVCRGLPAANATGPKAPPVQTKPVPFTRLLRSERRYDAGATTSFFPSVAQPGRCVPAIPLRELLEDATISLALQQFLYRGFGLRIVLHRYQLELAVKAEGGQNIEFTAFRIDRQIVHHRWRMVSFQQIVQRNCLYLYLPPSCAPRRNDPLEKNRQLNSAPARRHRSL